MFMAGVQGFEPWNGGIRIRCLTAWLYPIIKKYMVRVVRFELAHLSELESESSASTNSAIPVLNY